jgi:hypothetical protein
MRRATAESIFLRAFMPTIITFLLAPICLVMAVYRLITIPWQMYVGKRRLCTAPTLTAAVWASVAYCALLGYLLWLGVRIYNGFAAHHTTAAEVVRLVLYFEGKHPVATTLAPNRRLVYWRTTSPGCQRVGSNSSMRLFGCVGRRVSTSVR